MHAKFTALTPMLYEYLVAHNPQPDDVLRDLAAETAELGSISLMQVAVEQGAFLGFLARVIGARRAVEVGTFTGYSAISIARGLPPDGHLLCCDVSEEWTAIARRYFTRAGLEGRIELRLGPALDTLRALPDTRSTSPSSTPTSRTIEPTTRAAARLCRAAVVFDNVLWMGQVIDASDLSESTVAMRAVNDSRARQRVEAVMLPVANGITLVRRR
jgi:caffeoyl-CoA O-methyltransferase